VGWKEDIAFWANNNGREANKVEKIAINKGWEPKKYQTSMRPALLDYLDNWYTLSVKVLPEPATKSVKNRKNPFKKYSDDDLEAKQHWDRALRANNCQKYTKLSNGWRIWTLQDENTYRIIASDGNKYIEYANNTLYDSSKIHQRLIKQLRKNNG
jgi:hypothetical protein